MATATFHYTADDAYGLDKPVYVLDDIKVKPGCQAAMLALMTEQYLPLALERQMELAGAWLFPPFERSDKPMDMVYLWRFDTLETWWKVRATEENDVRLPAFWKQAEALIVSRSRRLGRPPQPMATAEWDRSGVGTPPPPAAGTRHIAIVKPRRNLGEGERAAWSQAAEAAVALGGVQLSRAGFHTDLSFFPGQMTWDIVSTPEFPISEEALLSRLPGPAEIVEWVTLGEAVGAGSRQPLGPVLEKRTVLFRLGETATREQRGLLEETLGELASRVEGVRAWRLSRVDSTTGQIAWTHCFEQEFRDHQVVTKEYLEHPFHWAVADRLFGPEGPEKLVHEFIHTMRPTEQPMLTVLAARAS